MLWLHKKIEIAKRLEKGEKENNMALEYGIGTSVVSDI
jgi:hypothetical protein